MLSTTDTLLSDFRRALVPDELDPFQHILYIESGRPMLVVRRGMGAPQPGPGEFFSVISPRVVHLESGPLTAVILVREREPGRPSLRLIRGGRS